MKINVFSFPVRRSIVISKKIGIAPNEIKNEHVLFVEGKDYESLDPTVLNELFAKISYEGNGIPLIKPLGASFSIKSVAEALHLHHPTYYFIIDRDYHYSNDDIQKYWEEFPNLKTNNLLIWRRREVENYFLEPDFLIESKYCKIGKEELQEKICIHSQQRLFLDVANYVVITIREELKTNWIKKFSNPDEFPTREIALEKLKSAEELIQRPTVIKNQVSFDNIEEKFNNYLNLMTGGQSKIGFDKGEWLSMIQGKQVLKQVINSNCFHIPANEGVSLSGKDKLNAVAKDLLNKNDSILPEDFITLRQLISKRINESK